MTMRRADECDLARASVSLQGIQAVTYKTEKKKKMKLE